MLDSYVLSLSPFMSQLYCLCVLSCFSSVGNCLVVHVRLLSFIVVAFYPSAALFVYFVLSFCRGGRAHYPGEFDVLEHPS